MNSIALRQFILGISLASVACVLTSSPAEALDLRRALNQVAPMRAELRRNVRSCSVRLIAFTQRLIEVDDLYSDIFRTYREARSDARRHERQLAGPLMTLRRFERGLRQKLRAGALPPMQATRAAQKLEKSSLVRLEIIEALNALNGCATSLRRLRGELRRELM